MKIKVIFDNVTSNINLKTGWGVSFLIEDNILFDTGERSEWLLENIKVMQVDINKIDKVAISHDHWDHTGGLEGILRRKGSLRVYICPGFSSELKKKITDLKGELIELPKFTEISKGIFMTGEIPGAYHGKYMPEQAIVLKTANGISVITGCAHPGILKIVDAARFRFPGEDIYFVLGGFHLKESDKRAIEIAAEGLKALGVRNVGPTHCSGEQAEYIFKKIFGSSYVSIEAGKVFEV